MGEKGRKFLTIPDQRAILISLSAEACSSMLRHADNGPGIPGKSPLPLFSKEGQSQEGLGTHK